MSKQFQNANKIKFMPLPYIGMFDLDVIYQSSDAELLYQVLYKINEIAKSQNIIIDNFQKVIEWATEQIEQFTKEQLEEWLNDGTLENVILALGQVVKYFDTTEEMKNIDNLVDGMTVITKGYYNANDGGSGIFLITNQQNDNTFQIQCAGGLYASLINGIYARQYGLGHSTDDSELMQQVYNVTNHIIFKDGTYYFNIDITDKPYTFDCVNANIQNIGNGYCFNYNSNSQNNTIEFKNITFNLNNTGGAIFLNKISFINAIVKENKIINCNFIGNIGYSGNMVNLSYGSNYVIDKCYFDNSVNRIDEPVFNVSSNAIVITGVINSIITDCFITSLNYAIAITNGTHTNEGIQISNNQFLHCIRDITMFNVGNFKNLFITITNNLFDMIHECGIYLTNSNNSIISDNWFGLTYKNNSSGVIIESSNNNSMFNNVSNNTFVGSNTLTNNSGITYNGTSSIESSYLICTNNMFTYLLFDINNNEYTDHIIYCNNTHVSGIPENTVIKYNCDNLVVSGNDCGTGVTLNFTDNININKEIPNIEVNTEITNQKNILIVTVNVNSVVEEYANVSVTGSRVFASYSTQSENQYLSFTFLVNHSEHFTINIDESKYHINSIYGLYL